MRFLKIALNEKYLMIINSILVFYIYEHFLKSYTLTNSEFYNFFIDVMIILFFTYISTIMVITLLIFLIYTIYINNKYLKYFTIFRKLEAVAITIEYIDEFKNISEFQLKFDQVLTENIT